MGQVGGGLGGAGRALAGLVEIGLDQFGLGPGAAAEADLAARRIAFVDGEALGVQAVMGGEGVKGVRLRLRLARAARLGPGQEPGPFEMVPRGDDAALRARRAMHVVEEAAVAHGVGARRPFLFAPLELQTQMIVLERFLRAQLAEHFARGVDVVLDYLWGPVAERLLRAAAKASPEAKRIRFVQIGNAAGGEIAFAAPWLRSSGLELMGSGLGSVSLPGLIGAIDGVFRAANAGALILPIKTMPLSEVEQVWNAKERERIVFLPD